MSDLIDRQNAIDKINDYIDGFHGIDDDFLEGLKIARDMIAEVPCRACSVDDMKCEIEDAPTVDAVPVIRCKDCKYYDDREWLKCPMLEPTEKDDYCSKAERKEE